jgi:5-methylcytosine-specific restriction endonuclease McrA
MERDGFRCRRCGHGPDVAPLVVDHVVPVAKGGTRDDANLQTLCQPCNCGKSDRDPHPHDFRGLVS